MEQLAYRVWMRSFATLTIDLDHSESHGKDRYHSRPAERHWVFRAQFHVQHHIEKVVTALIDLLLLHPANHHIDEGSHLPTITSVMMIF